MGCEVSVEFAAVFDEMLGGFFDIWNSEAECGDLDIILAEVEADGAVFGFQLSPVGVLRFDCEAENLGVEGGGFFKVFDTEGDISRDDEVGFHGSSILRGMEGSFGGFRLVFLTIPCVEWRYGTEVVTTIDFGGCRGGIGFDGGELAGNGEF